MAARKKATRKKATRKKATRRSGTPKVDELTPAEEFAREIVYYIEEERPVCRGNAHRAGYYGVHVKVLGDILRVYLSLSPRRVARMDRFLQKRNYRLLNVLSVAAHDSSSREFWWVKEKE